MQKIIMKKISLLFSDFFKPSFFYAAILLIIVAGIFFRFWQLDSIPPGIHYDEAYNGIDALKAIESGNYKVFYPENTGREGFHINAIALFIKMFGNDRLGLRFANAIWGSLTIIGFYFLLQSLKFSKISILLGTFMMSFSFWHLVFSRTAYRAIMVPMVVVWMFYFFLRAVNSPKRNFLFFIISGLIMGLGFHSYIAFRIAPVALFIFILALIIFKDNFFKSYWKYFLVFAVSSFLVILPLLFYFSGHFKDLVSRSESVSIFNTPKYSPWEALEISLNKHAGAFFVSGDHNPRHNYNDQPLLPDAWSVLFAIGFIISLKEIIQTVYKKFIQVLGRKNESPEKKDFVPSKLFFTSVLAQAIFWVLIIPGVLSIEGIPHSLRIIGVIPAVFIFAILPFEYLMIFFRFLSASKKEGRLYKRRGEFLTIILGIVVMVIFGGFSQVHIYFDDWARDVRTQGAYERKLYDFGVWIRELPVHKNNYVVVVYNTFVSNDGAWSSLKTTEFLAYPKIKSYIFLKPIEGAKSVSCEDPQIVFLDADQWLRDQYKAKCPNLQQKRKTFDNGKFIFWYMGEDVDNI
jgi:hypothetical protein